MGLMVDVDAIVYQVLTQDGTALDALIDGRAEFTLAPPDFANTQALVVYRPESGDGGLFGSPVHERSYLFECYGGDAATDTWAGAAAVFRALRDLWHDSGAVTVAAGVMMQGWEEQAGVPLANPKTNHKYIVCRMAGKFKGA